MTSSTRVETCNGSSSSPPQARVMCSVGLQTHSVNQHSFVLIEPTLTSVHRFLL